MPEKIGLFLGLTAFQMNGADALFAGTANYLLGSDDKEPLLDAIAEVSWDKDAAANHRRLSALLETRTAPSQESFLASHQDEIARLCEGELTEIAARFAALDVEAKPEFKRPRDTFLAGSPLSAHIIWHQAIVGDEFSLDSCFLWELGVSVNCCAHGDFVEGVRALLIDKDRNPKWQFADVAAVPDDVVRRLLTSPWQGQPHPLADL